MELREIPERLRRSLSQRAVPALVVAALLAVAIGTGISLLGSSGSGQVVAATASESAEPLGTLYVHVTGAVNRPGLVTVSTGARVVDAIAAAGGLTAEADQAAINLARAVNDGEQLIVPRVGEATIASGTTAGGLVNLNTADQAALEALPHIGPALAARIIAWRTEHGSFTSVDDLRQVSGIGDKTFADLEPLVTV